MLRPSPVLTPSPANRSPTTFRYAPPQSPPPISPRSAVSPIVTTTPARSSGAAGTSSPRPSGSSAAAARKRDARSTAPVAVPAAAASDRSSATMVSSVGESSDQPLPTAVTAAPETETEPHAAPSIPEPSASTMAVNDGSMTNTSPSKRRGEEFERASAVAAEPADENSTKPAKRPRQDEQPPKVLPLRYELCPVEDMVELIAHMLNELIATNDAIRTTSGGLTRFHSRAAPGISVRDYLHRLAKHATLIPPLLLSMVYYIDRLCALYPEFTINTLTVHRFLITAATVAAKGLSDSFWNNTTYARVGGVRLAELKMLELEFLYRVDWRIVPNPEVLVAYYKGLVERTPGYVLEGEDIDSMDGVQEEDDDE